RKNLGEPATGTATRDTGLPESGNPPQKQSHRVIKDHAVDRGSTLLGQGAGRRSNTEAGADGVLASEADTTAVVIPAPTGSACRMPGPEPYRRSPGKSLLAAGVTGFDI
ncbi:hypothetical protein, partial [Streptomyces sp. H27-H5]|uniref:hypothetical protein n=1 Tax=Streptomyces sp. H27-H5 TaxID=2996460 RepID=UPI002271F924